MTSKFLEAKAIINQKSMDIVNTQMDISVDYTCKLSDGYLYLSIDKIYGNFTYKQDAESYKKNIVISFSTDNTWDISTPENVHLIKNGVNLYSIEPESTLIDFDKKKVSVKF